MTGLVTADDLASGVWGLALLAGLGVVLRALLLRGKRQAGALREGRGAERTSTSAAAGGQGVQDLERATRELAGRLLREHEYVDLRRLRDDHRVAEQAGLLADPRFPFEALERLSVDRDNFFVAAVALAAIERRPDVPDAWTTRAIAQLRSCPTNIEPCVYAALARRASYPVVGPSLANLDEGINWDELASFVEARLAGGEELTAETFKSNLPVRLSDRVSQFAALYRVQLGERFFALAEEWARTTVDTDFIAAFARIWDPPGEQSPHVDVARRGELAEVVADALSASPPRSVLLVGETGAGKRTLARAALARLGRGPVVFEATASQFNAGAVYVGELEDRVKQLAARLARAPVVWVCPAFEETVYAGQHTRNPKGLLDALAPHLRAGDLAMIGLLTPSELERILAERPQVSGLFEIVRVQPLPEEAAVEVARETLARREPPLSASTETLQEAYELAQQFLPHQVAPGNLLRLLSAAAEEVASDGRREIESSDCLAALAAASGLPLALLDPDAPLDLAAVRVFFERRVLGQDHAVDTVIERVLIAKAGLSDPTRPLAVLLFVGPTGTGKTELAKALAEFMFGSASRMIRLDMSEYQTHDALERLLSDASADRRGSALITSVRKDPFSVVLLDEFEKAAAPIWDLFLQVFDDGRLSDQRGRVTDFRRCMIVLTSNVGSALAYKSGIGFGEQHGRFRGELIEEELRRSFRPEFLNRIDRVVVFHPFTRAQMRALLDKELAQVLERRGLRGRPWAVEVDESAYEFLIERGFSPHLGARPLKRALEQHLLAPIATAISTQQVPSGEQFLYASARGEQIEVQFVDPNLPADRDGDVEAGRPDSELELRALALTGSRGEATPFLLDALTRIETTVAGPIAERKQSALAQMQEQGFWERDDRHQLLSEIEYLDRLESATEGAGRLARRLARRNGNDANEFTRLLATRLYVLEAALEGVEHAAPADLYLHLHPSADSEPSASEDCCRQLADMYAGWAAARGMRLHSLDEEKQLYLVSGLGAWTILAPETGIHVFELYAGPERRPERVNIRCEIAPCTPTDLLEPDGLAQRALVALRDQPGAPALVRRYRREPSPLVRDAARGYRTGRLELVLAGAFDLL